MYLLNIYHMYINITLYILIFYDLFINLIFLSIKQYIPNFLF